jgi:hypothetical protein
LNRNPRIPLVILLAGCMGMLIASCGDDDGGPAPCPNCGFWEMAYGGVGRFPAVSPDPDVIAFTSRVQFPEKIECPFDPADLSIGRYYHVWLARVEEDISDTVWYYQITDDASDDFLPSWAPDGNLIAFERNIGKEDERQIFVVDVADPENPGVPVQVTDEGLKPPTAGTASAMNASPSWASVGGSLWLSFVNYPKGASDYDIGLLSWDDRSDTVWVSIDPVDFAVNENGVMSFTFKDQQASSNGSRLIAFSSPDRKRVGDITVLAKSEEQPDSSVVSRILINGKESGKFTPYTFRYRPEDLTVRISGRIQGYCSEAGDSLVTQADVTQVFVIDFRHTHGTLGVSATTANLYIYLDGDRQLDPRGVPWRTYPSPDSYIYLNCIEPEVMHEIYTQNVFGLMCGEPIETAVAAGETTWVTFYCERVGSPAGPAKAVLESNTGPSRGAGGDATLLTQQEERGIWIVDVGEETGIEDDRVYLVDDSPVGAYYPVLSPDGNYLAYFRGEYTSWEVVIADISGLISGSGEAVLHVVGLPGSTEDFECWRKPEKISWVPGEGGTEIVVSLSPCRGGAPSDFGIWVADISRFLR